MKLKYKNDLTPSKRRRSHATSPSGSAILKLQTQKLILLLQKAIFWENQKTLILSDLHIGKAAHFRKNGIPIPSSTTEQSLDILTNLINQFKPEKCLILGDLFHSKENNECITFKNWRNKYSKTKFILIRGNHDILSEEFYSDLNLETHSNQLQIENFLFTHEPKTVADKSLLIISGHIHPGIRLIGEGKQTITLPCFYFSKNQAIIPAFGTFTGLHIIKPKAEDTVFAITQNEVIKLN